MRRHLLLVLLLAVAPVRCLHAQQPPPPSQTPQTFADLPWPAKIGVRSHAVSQAFPLLDRVVLVPDAATFVDELKQWSPLARWPVLMEDHVLAPMFIRRFKPAQIVRRTSVLAEHAKFLPSLEEFDSIIVHAFGGIPSQHTLRQVFDTQQYAPPGVVITSLRDPAWTGALALAVGRGQPIALLPDDITTLIAGKEEIDPAAAQKLCAAVDRLVEEQNYSFRAMGDDIETITVCAALPVRAARASSSPAAGAQSADGPVAVTDLIGRHSDGSRYAVTGWVFGDERQAAYMAMCSLFLPREDAWLFNTYASEGEWGVYGFANAVTSLKREGFTIQQFSPPNADERSWLRMLVGGISTDMAFMNTKGYHDFFDLSSGQAHPQDVPVLNHPVVLHLIHSWSMFAPARQPADTTGAMWLKQGAYAAVGSCYEPYLAAFVPPNEVTNRCLSFVPFLVAARWWEGQQGPMSKPWRVVTIGDPLMLCVSPAKAVKARIEPGPVLPESGVELIEELKRLMREAKDDASGRSYGEAMRILNLLGRDDVAAGLWRIVSADLSAVPAEAAARAALDPLFRLRNAEEFQRAWDAVPPDQIDDRARDMLWHLLTLKLGGGNALGRDSLRRLELAVRQPYPHHDLKRIVPLLAATFGNEHAIAAISRVMKKTTASGTKAALAELLSKY